MNPFDGQTEELVQPDKPISEQPPLEQPPKPAETQNAEASEPCAELESRLRALEAENSQLKDQYLRKVADFENIRKRMQRDKQESIQYANQQLLVDLMGVIDDFERAIRSAEVSKDFDAFHDGIVLIEKQFTDMLERKWGLKRFDSAGTPFDPERHEAIQSEPVAGHVVPMVIEDYLKGYTLHERVIRASKVKVSLPGGSESPVG